jgi:anti-sigma28 factor (negative regulator of flagellin synthesis)
MEGGGVRLSYTNGIGSLQQFTGAAEIAASSSANRTAKTEPALVAAQDGFEGSSPVDETTLSSAASAFAQALSGDDVRSDKVTGLQQSILAGTYSVPAPDVAAKVLSALLQ